MDDIPIRLKVWRLFCYHGADDDDSEPYMWVIGFKFDGNTIQQQLASLSFTPDFFFSQGSHGNIGGGGVAPGTKIGIPASVGTWETSLKPIELTNASGVMTKAPGGVGFIAVVLEENNVTDDAAEAGHQALNGFVQTTLANFVTGINLVQFNQAVQQRVNAGSTREQALQDEFKFRLATVQQTIINGAPSVVKSAMRNAMNIPEQIWAAFDKDQMNGNAFHFVTSKQLIGESDFVADFTDMLADNPSLPEAGNWAYNLHSYVKAKVRWKAIPNEIPAAHDIQIQGILKGYSRDRGKFYISDVGGVVGGKAWRLGRSEACTMIDNGSKSFYVLDTNGGHVPVVVVSPPSSHWSYLTTPADNRPDNNLLTLPKLYDVPGFITRELEVDPFG